MNIVVKLKQEDTPHCPVCDHNLDCHSGTNHNHLPKTGDVSVCINCASVLVYECTKNSIGLRLPTEEENEVFYNDEHIQKVVQTVKLVKNGRKDMPEVPGA